MKPRSPGALRAKTLPVLAAVLFAAAAMFAATSVAHAQVSLGAPLIDANIEQGTIVVRVVNGSMSRPMSSLTVSLVDDASGKELVVRTGPDGRAPFPGLKVGGSYTAFIKVGDKEAASQPIKLPTEGGVRVLLSPVPLRADPAGGAEAGPHGGGGGAQGMPDPRNMSGMPRGEPKDRAGLLTIRTIQGKFRNDEIAGRVADFPKDGVVHLISLKAGGTIEVTSSKVDDEGRVQFDRLKTDNSVSYWVLSAFNRNGKWDRLQSPSIELPPRVGLRLMLAGLAPDSPAAGVDDIQAIRAGEPAPKIGRVLVELAGQSDRISNVELVELTTMKVVGSAKPALEQRRGPVQARIGAGVTDAALRDGLLQVRVSSPTGALAGAKVTLVPKKGAGEPSEPRASDSTGLVSFEGLTAGGEYSVVVEAVGTGAPSPSFVLPPKGGVKLDARFVWQNRPAAMLTTFDGIDPGIYIARAKNDEGSYWSPPFQMVPDRGAIAQMFVYPTLLFKFQGGAELDDERLWFPTQMALWNPSVMPIDFGKEGLLIPLPRGFVGAAVADEMTNRIRIDNDHGFIWKGAFPPGQRSFRGSFALPVEDGDVEFEMPLPFGSFDSHLSFEDMPGMELNVPTSAKRDTMDAGGKRFIVLKQISVRPGQSLTLSVRGLPQKPGWKRSMPLIVGIGVLSLLLWGFASIFLYGTNRVSLHPGSREFFEQKREDLLAQLVVLDDKLAKQDGDGKKASKKKKATIRSLREERSKLTAELESVYAKLDE